MAGGVGYEAHVPLSTFYELPDPGQDVELFIKTVVREDAIELFGFMTRVEKEAFILLNTVSKVGPRLAMNILSGIAPAELVSAVGHKNVARLNSVPGVGAKTAERLVVELKDKISALAALAGTAPSAISEPEPLDDTGQDVVSRLAEPGIQPQRGPESREPCHDPAGSRNRGPERPDPVESQTVAQGLASWKTGLSPPKKKGR